MSSLESSDRRLQLPHPLLTAIQQRTLELIARGESLATVLAELCDAIDALDADVISTSLLMDPDGEHLWPTAGRRAPAGWTRFIGPLHVGPCMGSCGTAAFRRALRM
jgi:hypothetical protein